MEDYESPARTAHHPYDEEDALHQAQVELVINAVKLIRYRNARSAAESSGESEEESEFDVKLEEAVAHYSDSPEQMMKAGLLSLDRGTKTMPGKATRAYKNYRQLVRDVNTVLDKVVQFDEWNTAPKSTREPKKHTLEKEDAWNDLLDGYAENCMQLYHLRREYAAGKDSGSDSSGDDDCPAFSASQFDRHLVEHITRFGTEEQKAKLLKQSAATPLWGSKRMKASVSARQLALA